MKQIERKTYKKGEVIVREGELDMRMFDIVAGSVDVYSGYGSDREHLIATLRDGESFGEMELVSIRARSATVVAKEKTEVMVIDNETFTDYIKNKPEKIISIMQTLSDRLRVTTAEYVEACHVAREAVEEAKKGKKRSSWFEKLVELGDKYEGELESEKKSGTSDKPEDIVPGKYLSKYR